jgi:type VI secretion system protein ImpL
VKLLFRILLATLIWSLVIGVAAGISYILLEDIVPGAKIGAGLFVIWYGFALVRWIYRRQMARRRVEKLINVAPDSSGKIPGIWRIREQRSEQEDRFVEVLEFFQATRLRRHGDTVYVLPWSLVLGDSMAAVPEWLDASRLSGPTLDHPVLHGSGNDIAWRLTNHHVLLRTPASWSAAATASHPEWLSLLMMLNRHRHREPLNSLVISVAATWLVSADSDSLEMAAKSYRRMLEDIVQILGVTVPVTIVITGFENLNGAPEWMNTLPDVLRDQPFGDVAGEEEVAAFCSGLMKRLAAKVSEMNLLALRDGKLPSATLGLPATVASMAPALSRFAASMLERNPYQEDQRLNGVFLAGIADKSSDNARTLFSVDLIDHLIPQSRNEYRLLDAAERRRAAVRNRRAAKAGVATALTLALLAGLQSYDTSVIQAVHDDYVKKLTPSDDLDVVVDNLVAYRDMVDALSEKRYLPWVGLNTEPDVVGKMRDDLANRVDARIVTEIDRLFLERLELTFFRSAKTDVDKAAEYAGVVIRQINLLTAFRQGSSAQSLREMPQPFDTETFAGGSSEQLAALNDLYVTSLVWAAAENKEAAASNIDQRLVTLRQRLDRILARAGTDMTWLIEWANQSSRLKVYRVSDYWREGSGVVASNVVVPKAYTLAGKLQIDSFIEELRSAKGDSQLLEDALPKFRQLYRTRYLQAWESFAIAFGGGMDSLKTRDEWLGVINQLHTRRNHFFMVLNLIDNELEPFRKDDGLPDWVTLLGFYQDMRALSGSPDADNSKRNSVLTKLALKTIGKLGSGGKMLATGATSGMANKEKVDKASAGPTPDERAKSIEDAAALLDEYQKALGEFVYTAEVRSSSFSAVSALFNDPENPAKGGSPYATAYGAIQKLQGLIGKENSGNTAFWRLMKGPLAVIREYMLQESSCQLDSLWRNTVLAELEGVPDYKRDEYLRGESGILWNFLSTTGKPFFAQELGRGYSVRRIEGSFLDVSPRFLTFVARSRDARKAAGVIDVEIRAFPTSLNLDARASVRRSTLSISCVDGTHELNNFNYPVSSSFGWSGSCNSVILDIDLGVLTLQKKWSGQRAFAEFIREFTAGPRSYRADEFPRQATQLAQLGVDEVRVQYDVDGAEEVLKSVALAPMQVPESAASCWAF